MCGTNQGNNDLRLERARRFAIAVSSCGEEMQALCEQPLSTTQSTTEPTAEEIAVRDADFDGMRQTIMTRLQEIGSELRLW